MGPLGKLAANTCLSRFCNYYVHVHVHIYQPMMYNVHVHSSYMTLIWVHELHGQIHPNQDHVTDLFANDPLSLFGYLTVSPTHPVIPIGLYRQWQTF